MITPERKTFKIGEIKPAPYNPRQISKEALVGLSESLKKFGYLENIVVNIHNGDPVCISGHQRLKAMEMQGVKEVEVAVVDFDELTEKAANVALNNSHTAGDYNADLLEPLLVELQDFAEFKELRFDELAGEFDFNDMPDFQPSDDEPPRLDEKKKITCPGCGHEFES